MSKQFDVYFKDKRLKSRMYRAKDLDRVKEYLRAKNKMRKVEVIGSEGKVLYKNVGKNIKKEFK